MKRIAVVTGASAGMGRDFVIAADREFAPEEIWVIARREDRLVALQDDVKAKIVPLALDLSKPEAWDEYSAKLEAEKPEICLLINAAGYGKFCTFEKYDLNEQLGMIDLNIKGLTAMCHRSLPYMKEGDKIINLGSNSSWQPVPYIGVYGAGKAYVLSFSRALGRELKTRGIQVLCACPGWVRTEFMDRAVNDDTIKYYDRWYESKDVVDKAMKDLRKGKTVSICGLPVRLQVFMVKHLPTDWIMSIWCKQQGKP
ncbi:MAG: SDR family NAD(P)-dependent oxidoreductase [Eubacteriales bacterium]|nr:SDR family NAD(P)-dependent oxidoreductase [Eubacteriales bacterium]